MKDSMRLRLRLWGAAAILLSALCWPVGSSRLLGADGNDSTDHSPITQAAQSVGCPLAPGMVALLEGEINEGLKQRGIESNSLSSPVTRAARSTIRRIKIVGPNWRAIAG
jgi:hypothetical protein